MGKFDRQIKSAQRLIKLNGQLVKWRTINDSVPVDPDEPWKPSSSTPVDNDVNICFLPVDLTNRETLSFFKDSVIPKGCVLGLMGAVGFTPCLKDVVIRDGKELAIESLDILSPNGQTILYTMVLK